MGKHEWTFKIIKIKKSLSWTVTIGIWKCDKDFAPLLNSIFLYGNPFNRGYGFKANLGVMVNPENNRHYGSATHSQRCTTGDTVRMCLDMDRLKLKYTVN